KLLPSVSGKFTESLDAFSKGASNPLATPNDQNPSGDWVSQTPPGLLLKCRRVTVRFPLPGLSVTVNTPSSFPSGANANSACPTRSRSWPSKLRVVVGLKEVGTLIVNVWLAGVRSSLPV